MGSKNRIEGKSVVLSALSLLRHKETRKSSLQLLKYITTDFFLLQFQRKLHLRKNPIIHVDHPLDATIPFSPDHVKIYLSFSQLWLKSLRFLYAEFGKNALPEINDFLIGLTQLYRNSARIYRKRMSTTNRPRNVGGLYFKVIHTFDPHLLCVPSLHIEVVFFTYIVSAKILDLLSREEENYMAERGFLWNQAVLISDSIMFIKQHSINCIAAGLFMLSKTGSVPLHPDIARTVIAELFTGEGNCIESADEIKEYIRHLYEQFLREGEEKAFDDVIVDFLDRYTLSKEVLTGKTDLNQGS